MSRGLQVLARAALLYLHDRLRRDGMPPHLIPRWLGEQLHASPSRGQFGPSVEAIAKHVRRLVGQRQRLMIAAAQLPPPPAPLPYRAQDRLDEAAD